MNQIVESKRYSNSQIRLMQNTVARGTTDDEFKQFIETAARYNLDPFKKQIHCVLFSANDPEKRQMAIIVGIGGYRTLGYRAAKEMGFDVRPDSSQPQFVVDPELEGPLNPKGLVTCTVNLYVRHNPQDDWQPVTGSVDWDERASYRRKNNEQQLDYNWRSMPKNMLAKCAEADAWRKIVPDDISGLYIEDEIRADMIDITEQVENLDIAERQKKTGGPGILVQWAMGSVLEKVPVGQMADRCFAHISAVTDPGELRGWYDTNRTAFTEFWALNKGEALEVKRAYEARIAVLDDQAEQQEKKQPQTLLDKVP